MDSDVKADLKTLEEQQPPQAHPAARRGGVRKSWKATAVFATYLVGRWMTTAVLHAKDDEVALESSWAYKAFGHKHCAHSINKFEKLYLSVPDEQSALEISRVYATHPHIAASAEDFNDAKIILKLFQDEFGIAAPEDEPIFSAGSEASRNATLNINKLTAPTAWIDTYYPIMNSPLDRSLQILGEDGEVLWDADLVEDGDPGDPEAAKYRDSVPTFHGLSADGEVEGQLIYANYGRKEDYDELDAKGVNFTGKIVLTRSGGIFRGLKVYGAQERGAVGVLVYSDPRDDGSVTIENGYTAYPAGPARNPTSVERGSVQFISVYPGDPTTPGYPAYENATRTDADGNIPRIPSLPISWANAVRLLAEISDEHASRALTGAASNRKIRLVNHVDTKVMPIWNTMAAIPGHLKNETVMIGVHRDAWVMGAADPTSGTVSLHEVVKGFGTLLKNGWKPLRNIVFASWDAEEYGGIGSTEYVEDFEEWIGSNVVAYINLDVSTAGSQYTLSASPTLAHLIRQVALEIPHPTDANRTLWDARKDEGPYAGTLHPDAIAAVEQKHHLQSADTGIPPLGSGSDFTAFLQRIGIASMDQAFMPTATDAVYHYHSIYDSERWMGLYGDPGYHRHVAVAKHMGVLALRIIDSVVLPLNTTQYTLELDGYLELVLNDAPSQIVDAVDFHGLRHSFKKLQKASHKLDKEKVAAEKKFRKLLGKLPKSSSSALERFLQRLIRYALGKKDPVKQFIKAAKRVQRANAKLVAFEKGFISEEGIKDREWYRHLVIAPGKWLGYGATPFPSIYDALVYDRNATLAQEEVHRVRQLLEDLAEKIHP